jgi:hypothetical protein
VAACTLTDTACSNRQPSAVTTQNGSDPAGRLGGAGRGWGRPPGVQGDLTKLNLSPPAEWVHLSHSSLRARSLAKKGAPCLRTAPHERTIWCKVLLEPVLLKTANDAGRPRLAPRHLHVQQCLD